MRCEETEVGKMGKLRTGKLKTVKGIRNAVVATDTKIEAETSLFLSLKEERMKVAHLHRFHASVKSVLCRSVGGHTEKNGNRLQFPPNKTHPHQTRKSCLSFELRLI